MRYIKDISCPIDKRHRLIRYGRVYYCPYCDVAINTIVKDDYDNKYFLESKINRYGKLYKDIEGDLKKVFLNRINWIQGFITTKKPTLLDIGSAFGLFVKLSRKLGIEAEGVEVSRYAIEMAKKLHNIDLINKNFLELDTNSRKYDIITMWYVLEHFWNINRVLEKIGLLLRRKGILALSVPSVNGPLFRFSLKKWYKVFPKEHYYEFSPISLEAILRKHNFKDIYMRIVSFHKERIPLFGSLIPDTIYKTITKLFLFGDTIELLAIKK